MFGLCKDEKVKVGCKRENIFISLVERLGKACMRMVAFKNFVKYKEKIFPKFF